MLAVGVQENLLEGKRGRLPICHNTQHVGPGQCIAEPIRGDGVGDQLCRFNDQVHGFTDGTVSACCRSRRSAARYLARRVTQAHRCSAFSVVAIAAQLLTNEKLFPFHDDIYVVCNPDRVGAVHQLQRELWHHSRITLRVDPEARVWRGDVSQPLSEQGLKILGTPVGQPEFVRAELAKLLVKHQVLMDRIPAVNDLQSAWLLLTFCNPCQFLPSQCPTQVALEFATAHDANVWQCFCGLLDFHPEQITANGMVVASLPLRLGGLGIRSAVGTQAAAHWASWADALAMIHARHPAVAHSIVRALDGHVEVSFVQELQWCADSLARADFVAPSWEALADGLRPPPSLEEEEPGWSKHGRNMGGRDLLVGVSMTRSTWTFSRRCLSVTKHLLADEQVDSLGRLFRTLLLRRLRVPLPLTARACRCGLPLDAFGHHRSACAVSAVLGRRGFAECCRPHLPRSGCTSDGERLRQRSRLGCG